MKDNANYKKIVAEIRNFVEEELKDSYDVKSQGALTEIGIGSLMILKHVKCILDRENK